VRTYHARNPRAYPAVDHDLDHVIVTGTLAKTVESAAVW
jgi:hypothetical protein